MQNRDKNIEIETIKQKRKALQAQITITSKIAEKKSIEDDLANSRMRYERLSELHNWFEDLHIQLQVIDYNEGHESKKITIKND